MMWCYEEYGRRALKGESRDFSGILFELDSDARAILTL